MRICQILQGQCQAAPLAVPDQSAVAVIKQGGTQMSGKPGHLRSWIISFYYNALAMLLQLFIIFPPLRNGFQDCFSPSLVIKKEAAEQYPHRTRLGKKRSGMASGQDVSGFASNSRGTRYDHQ
jgi:hypothetical protein